MAGDSDEVRAALALDLEGDARATVQTGDTARLGHSVLDDRDLAQANQAPRPLRDDLPTWSGRLAEAGRDWRDDHAFASALVRDHPDQSFGYAELAFAEMTPRPERALVAAQRAVALDAGNPRHWSLVTNALMALGRRQQAYAAAARTLERLREVPGSDATLEELAEPGAQLEALLDTGDPLAARARVYSPGNDGGAAPLWTDVPDRRTFSFAALSGNVERFEVRCERDRLEGPVEAGRTWSLPEGTSDCRVFVFGADGASFDFIEHNESESVDVAARSAVARSDVLD